MPTNTPPTLGNFVMFGITQDDEFLNHRLSERLGITPRMIEFGSSGKFFFDHSYGDVAESHELIALKLGMVRPRDSRTPLSAQQMLEQKIISASNLDHSAFFGHALVARFSKTDPHFSVYQTLMISPPLYYTRFGEGILCATNIRCLLAVLDDLQLNEDAIPMHFLFESVVGPVTYFKDIYRLFPGQKLDWRDGTLDVKLVQTFDVPPDMPTYDHLDTTSVKAVEEGMGQVMGAYLAEIEAEGDQAGNLLSGGVDSSVLQILFNDHISDPEQRLSFSYAVQAESFEFEIEYARHASELINSNHTYFKMQPEDFPRLLLETIELLGQPSLMFEGEIGKLVLAESLSKDFPQIRYFFTGQGADGLHGMAPVKKMAVFDTFNQIPGSKMGLQILSKLLAPISQKKSDGLMNVAYMLEEAQKPESFHSPLNTAAIATNIETLRPYFGDETLLKILDERNNFAAQYLNSSLMAEQTQIVDLMTASYEPALVGEQIFAAKGKRLLQIYLDEELVLLTFAIDPKVRFRKGLVTKPFLKEILSRRGFSVLAEKQKGASVFREDLYEWMQRGTLRDMIDSIDLPDFVDKSDFETMINNRDKFIWNALTLDLFQKNILKSGVW